MKIKIAIQREITKFVSLSGALVLVTQASLAEEFQFIPPEPNIEIRAVKPVERIGSYIMKEPYLPFRCGLRIYEEPLQENLSLQYIGSRKTWIPITGKVKEEKFYRVN